MKQVFQGIRSIPCKWSACSFFTRFRVVLMLLAVLTISTGIAKGTSDLKTLSDRFEDHLRVNERNVAAISNLEDRLKHIEDERIEDRLIRLETYSESNRWLLMTTAGGVILILLEAGARALKLKS